MVDLSPYVGFHFLTYVSMPTCSTAVNSANCHLKSVRLWISTTRPKDKMVVGDTPRQENLGSPDAAAI